MPGLLPWTPETPTASLDVPSGAGALPDPALVQEPPGSQQLALPTAAPAGAKNTGLLTPETLQVLLAGLGDVLAGSQGKVTHNVASLMTGRKDAEKEARAVRTEDRSLRNEERVARAAEETSARQGVEMTMKLADYQKKQVDGVYADADKHHRTSEGLSDADRSTRETALITRMVAANPKEVPFLATMFSDRTFGEDVSVLTKHISQRELNELKTIAPGLLARSEGDGKKILREKAESYAADDVSLQLANRAINVSRRLQADPKWVKGGTMDRDELRKSILDGGDKAELALFEGTRFSEAVRTSMDDRLTTFGFSARGAAAKTAEVKAAAAASAQAAKDVALDPKNIAGDIAAHVEKIRAEGPVKIQQAVQQASALIPVKVAEKTALDKLEAGAGPKPATLSDMSTFTGQYEAVSKDFRTVRDAYGRIIAAKPPTDEKLKGPADIALMVGFMKIIDPTTGVKEGEQATAANAGGISETIRNTYNRLVDGGKLSDNLRASFKTQARELFHSHRDTQLGVESEYKRMSSERGMKPDTVVPDLLGKYRTDGSGGKGAGEDLSKLSDAEVRRRLRGTPPNG